MVFASKNRPSVAFVGDSGSGGKAGAVPAPSSGDAAALKFLKADGTWAVPAGSSSPLNNLSATTDPLLTSDSTAGYSVGSLWVNTSAGRSWRCLSAAVGAAKWGEESHNHTRIDSPMEHMLGDILDYHNTGSPSANTVFYTRVPFDAGEVINSMRIYVDAGASAAKFVTMGIYSQVTPSSTSGTPSSRVAATASSAGSVLNAVKTVALTSPYTVPTTGFYWLALVLSSSSLGLAVSDTYAPNFIPFYEQSVGSYALPATASGLTNPGGSIPYLSAVEA